MTVTNRKKRVADDVRTTTTATATAKESSTAAAAARLSVRCDSINKRREKDRDFSASSDDDASDRTANFDEVYSPMTLPTPEDSTASWLDADDSYQATDFLDEAMCILHNEEEFSDAYHDRLRFEYDQWKRIPHLRIIGKRIDYSSSENAAEDEQQSCQIATRQTSANNNNRDSDLLRDRVIKIMTETLWRRLLDKADIKSERQRQSASESRRHSSGRMESALIVSSILPTNRPLMVFKSRAHLDTVNQIGPVCRGHGNMRYNKKPWSKSSVDVLPPIETHHQKKVVDKTKRWFSAVNAPGRNHTLPRPVTSVTTRVNAAINVCFDISIDGTSIKSSRKKGYCSPS